MTAPRYTISKAIREKYRIFPVTELELKRFVNLSLELFSYLRELKSIDFAVYFRVDGEMIEMITPKNFSTEMVNRLIAASHVEYDNLAVCIERRDYVKFEFLIQTVRERKIETLLRNDPSLDRKTIQVFSDLSGASQMIVRGGINNTVAIRAKQAASRLIDQLMDSHIAIGTLSRMILADATLYDHSAAVAMLAGIIARDLIGKDKTEAEKIARSGLYHDVGKTCVPAHILNKPGRFTPEEFEVIKEHASLGYNELMKAIKNGAPIEEEVARVALEHHEKFGGGGYPLQKHGRLEEHAHGIHLYSRVVSIADVYSALLMKRVYKEAYDQEHSLAIMRSLAPKDYDPQIWEKFEQSVSQSIDYYTTMDQYHDNLKHKGRILLVDDKESIVQVIRKKSKAAS